MKIVIDKEFKSLIPPLTDDEYKGLEESILKEGCRDALVAWGETLIDGHNRYEICTKYGIPFQTVQKNFSDRDSVKLWMMQNQLARRNLNEFQRIEITHKCEDAVKAKAAERLSPGTNQYTERSKENFPATSKGQARDELGSMAGVSGKTYEHAVAVMETAPAPVVEAARKNDLSINAAYQVTKMEPEQREEVAARIEHGEPPREVVNEVQKRPHVTNNSGNNEWYTPERYIELARDVLGKIDLDPASCEYANRTVRAARYFSEKNDGLCQEWRGRVWMNPPYSADLVGKFTRKFVDEYDAGHISEGIVLVNNATETAWFAYMTDAASAVVFTRGRIRYVSPERESLAPLQGQAFLYFGDNAERFIEVFSCVGWGAIIYDGTRRLSEPKQMEAVNPV